MRIWYKRVRLAFPRLTNYELDKMFAGNDRRPSADRVRTFERIEKGAVPNLSHKGPAGVDVVALVEQALPGSSELLHSTFWSIVMNPPGPQKCSALLESFIDASGLERIREDAFMLRFANQREGTEKSRRIHALDLALAHLLTPLNRLTLLVLLAREADFEGELLALELARSYFDEHLEWWLEASLHGADFDAYRLVLNRALGENRDLQVGKGRPLSWSTSFASRFTVPIEGDHGNH